MKMVDLEPRAGDAAGLLAAMANPKRLLMLCHLLDAELSVGELSLRVDLAQSPLSQHLSRLRALRLVSARRSGQSIRYRLASEEVGRLLVTLHGIYCAKDNDAAGPSVQIQRRECVSTDRHVVCTGCGSTRLGEGKEVARVSGAMSAEQIGRWVGDLLGPASR